LKPWKKQQWVIPPKENADFAARMEQVLDVYKRPYDPLRPVVCMDESPRQLIRETRVPLPGGPGVAERYDYEYERCGVCNVFLAVEPLAGQRMVKVTERRAKTDWAWFLRDISTRYPDAERITLVMDNLNTHGPGSFYETLPPPEAKELWDRFEFIYTPKHGSWLNMAEIEISVLIRQCLDRRIDTLSEIRTETQAWQHARDTAHSRIDWQFRCDDARIKLKRLYPTLDASWWSKVIPPSPSRRCGARGSSWRPDGSSFGDRAVNASQPFSDASPASRQGPAWQLANAARVPSVSSCPSGSEASCTSRASR
jgi:hypothetical protein